MIKQLLITHLYSYNIHIGHDTEFNQKLNYYILGVRFNFYIIDMNKSFFLLKKALYFLKNLSLNNGSFLFHYSRYIKLDVIYKCILLSISKYSNQQMITYNWKYGSIGNFFFSFYILIKEISYSWSKHQSYLFNFEKQKKIYKHYNIEGSRLDTFEYLFLNEPDLKNYKMYGLYSEWYEKWIKKSNTYRFWKLKKNSLKSNNFLKQLCLNDINNILKKKKC